jgi:hypothetical protein
MANLEVTGTLYRKMDTQRISDKLQKREFVIETTEEQYPQLVKFELLNDKCSSIDGYDLNSKVKVAFNLRGREWKKDDGTVAFFTSLNAWRVELVSVGDTATKQQAPPSQPVVVPTIGADEDLPF